MKMTTLLTYKITPFLPYRSKNYIYFETPGAEWLKRIFSKLLKKHEKELVSKRVDTTLFHGHISNSNSKTQRFPFIQYIHKENEFFVTGINEGAFALKTLLDYFQVSAVFVDDLYLEFHLLPVTEIEMKNTNCFYKYKIVNWLPFLNDECLDFESKSLKFKTEFLEQKLMDHITKDFNYYLSLSLYDTKIKIHSITEFPHTISLKHNENFRMITTEMFINIYLPDYNCFGNKKSIGFGLVERIK